MPCLLVLVVDDVESVRRLIRRILEHAGHRVLEASDGVEALACLAANPAVELVLTDLRMPNMDGWELATRLSGRSPRVPALFMSGYADQDSRTAVPPGANFLNKPFSGQELTAAVEAVLKGPTVS